jgi:cytidylate kinase
MTTRISITGELGSGKSTAAKYLAHKLGIEFLSTGNFQRDMAAKLGISTLELNHRADNDPSIDEEIDNRTRALEKSDRSFSIDSRLAWFFLPSSYKVFLVCPPEVAARRVIGQERVSESYLSPADAVQQLQSRHASERVRFLKTYGVLQGHYRNYNLVVDTTSAKAEEIGDAILATFNQSAPKPHLLAAPKNLFVLPGSAEDEASPHIEICCADRLWCVLRGHALLRKVIAAGDSLTPVHLVAQDDETVTPTQTARSLIERTLDRDMITAWEDQNGFRYAAYPHF